MSYHQFGANHVFMIFGRTDLQIGVSRAKFDAESDFEVRLAVAPQKPGQISEKPFKSGRNFRTKSYLFAKFGGFWMSYSKLDLKIRFGIKFCSRCTYPEVCATKNREKKDQARPPSALSPRLAPGLSLVRAFCPW